ncbi:hypothetical protein [Fulvivirga sediminis]|uniref:Uncharacterized protein n=1 Tax=Fulvivirga sediminis TaxID=2803949 RepID=A0A937FAQ6_9BACT|nr:hypothetical protein [Fulvivirga sediminis]MBL3658456.1 hypothetical protein [Fulvivirga sediminis]
MRLDEEHTFKAKHSNIKLVATHLDEPHPGHMIWKFHFYINNDLVQNPCLNYKWGGLYPDLDHFEMESENGRFIYLPVEKTLLYDVIKNQFIALEDKVDSKNNLFVMNKFSEGRLIIIHQRGFQVIQLQNMHTLNVLFPNGVYHLQEGYYIDDILVIKYKDLTDYKEYTKRYDFNKMAFEESYGVQ